MTGKSDVLSAVIAKFAKDRDWGQFHTPKNLAMALSVEAAEVAEIFQWLTEEQSKALSAADRAHLRDELADTYVYLLKLADCYSIDLVDAALKKMAKNARKYPVSKARGTAKKYTRL